MELLKQKILTDGLVLEGDILHVDHFLNQQIDIKLLTTLAEEFCRRFADCGITKILTVESSGIAIATLTAAAMGVPLVYAKKAKQGSAADHLLAASVDTLTLGQHFDVVVPKEYISAEDRVLVIDDFLAQGSTLIALLDLADRVGATVVGCGVMVEKVFRGGGEKLRRRGVRVEVLAGITAMSVADGITFAE